MKLGFTRSRNGPRPSSKPSHLMREMPKNSVVGVQTFEYSPLTVMNRKVLSTKKENAAVARSSPLMALRKQMKQIHLKTKRNTEPKEPKTNFSTPVVCNPLAEEPISQVKSGEYLWDLFVSSNSNSEKNSTSETLVDALRLRYGLKVWCFSSPEILEDGVKDTKLGSSHGVENSNMFLLVLHESIFQNPCVQMELLWAIGSGKRIIAVFENDPRKSLRNQIEDWIRCTPAYLFGVKLRSELRRSCGWLAMDEKTGPRFDQFLDVLLQSCEIEENSSKDDSLDTDTTQQFVTNKLIYLSNSVQSEDAHNVEDLETMEACVNLEAYKPDSSNNHKSMSVTSEMGDKGNYQYSNKVTLHQEALLDSKLSQLRAQLESQGTECIQITFRKSGSTGHQNLKTSIEEISSCLISIIPGFAEKVQDSVSKAIESQFGCYSHISQQDALVLWDASKAFRVLVSEPARMAQAPEKGVAVVFDDLGNCCEQAKCLRIVRQTWSKSCPEWLMLHCGGFQQSMEVNEMPITDDTLCSACSRTERQSAEGSFWQDWYIRLCE